MKGTSLEENSCVSLLLVYSNSPLLSTACRLEYAWCSGQVRGELVNDSIILQLRADRLKQENPDKENKHCHLPKYCSEQKAAIQCKVSR